jgi:predicted amidohydrolase
MVRVAAIQLALGKGSYPKALDDTTALIQQAKSEGAQIVCLPEHWLLEYKEKAYTATLELANMAKANRVYLITGANYTPVERKDGSRELRIRSSLLNPEGQTIGEQDKVHLFHGEKNTASPGEVYRVFPTSLGSVGITVCYDNVFPESARSLALKGADLLFVPSRIISAGLDPWILYLRTRALENRLPVIAPNVFDLPRYAGGSVIIDLERDNGVVRPKIVASAKTGESIITANVNVDLARELRRERLRDRRPEAY